MWSNRSVAKKILWDDKKWQKYGKIRKYIDKK